jgi:hypothetical protein
MVLVRDEPVAIDLSQSDGQPEQESALFRRAAGRVGAAPDDGDREGDVFAGGNCKLFDVERLLRLVIPEEQIPCFLVFIHSARLQRRRDVEHHDILFMMGKNAGKIMPADSVRPCFDDRRDLTFCGFMLLHHGSRSGCLPDLWPKGRTSGGVADTRGNFFKHEFVIADQRQVA